MEKGNQKINVAQGIALRRAFKTVVTFAGCFRRKFMFLLVVYSLGRSLLKKIFVRFASLKSLKNAIMDKESCWSVARSAFAGCCRSSNPVGGISKINCRKMEILRFSCGDDDSMNHLCLLKRKIRIFLLKIF